MKIVTPDHAANYGHAWASASAVSETTMLAMIGDDLRDLYEPLTDETRPGHLADLANRIESQITRARVAS